MLASSPVADWDAMESLPRHPLVPAVMATTDGQLIDANSAFATALGYTSPDELRGLDLRSLLESGDDSWRIWTENSQSTADTVVELEFRRRGGGAVFLSGQVSLLSANGGELLRGTFVDITASKQLREMSINAARMEALSSLTTGVAHDFNNLLTVLVGNLYLISNAVSHDEDLHGKLQRARKAAKRGADLTRTLLNFARGESADTDSIDTSRVIAELVPLLKSATGSAVKLQARIPEGLPTICVNRAYFESVITNLVVNARDAARDIDGGCVVLQAAPYELNGQTAQRLRLAPGNYLRLSVSDNGKGIPKEVMPLIFKPFFSTKPKGSGTGLGLPMVKWFAEQVNGSVGVKSESGTVVTVLIPTSQSESTDSTVRTMQISQLRGGSESVLIVSSDHDFESTLYQMLRTLGYAVTAVPPEQLRSFSGDPSAIEAAVVDGALSKISANSVMEWLSKHAGAAGVVFVGKTTHAWEGLTSLVSKPFTPIELNNGIRRVLKGE